LPLAYGVLGVLLFHVRIHLFLLFLFFAFNCLFITYSCDKIQIYLLFQHYKKLELVFRT
jgi:hypothetical protein